MSWSFLITILIAIVLLLIFSQTLQKAKCCETNLRVVLSTISIIVGIIWIIFILIYSINVVKRTEYTKVEITYLSKSKTRVYIEYDDDDDVKYQYYDNIKDMSIDTNTIFFIETKYNMYNYPDKELKYDIKLPEVKE
jgi:hypothetical protein